MTYLKAAIKETLRYFFGVKLREMKGWILFPQCLTSLLNLSHVYRGGQSTYLCFPRVSVTGTSHIVFPSPLAAFTSNHRKNSGRDRINPSAMIIDPWKKILKLGIIKSAIPYSRVLCSNSYATNIPP